MISVEEAHKRILDALTPTGRETVPIGTAFGQVLAETVTARRDQPPSDVSAMDGYACRAADIADPPAALRIIDEIPAGALPARAIGSGEAARIFTGAAVPDGADSIVLQEDTEREGETVRLSQPVEPFRHIRTRGGDFRAGQDGLASGTRLTARHIGLLAAMNIPWITVHRAPRIGILATGNELVHPGEPVGPGQIVSANSHGLAAAVTAWGGVPVPLGIAPDDAEALDAVMRDAGRFDLLVTSGGASVGDHDLVQDALANAGFSLDFWRIAMRPGKPLMFATRGDTVALGLPGNPVSAMVCALLFLRPALGRLAGADLPPLPELRLPCPVPLAANGKRADYMRARVETRPDGERQVTPLKPQDSAMMRLLSEADALLVRPPEAPATQAGDPVTVVPLGESGAFSF